MADVSRIMKNTVFLYLRMGLVVLVSLYTVRVIYNSLGVENYGIYDVVAGIVYMLTVISQTMTISAQRFISYSLGEKKEADIKKIMGTSLFIFLIISFIFILAGETLGLWFINNELVIPPNRLHAANWIFQFSIASIVVIMLSVPFTALIIAHENLKIYAIVGVLDSILKLIVVFLLYIIQGDKLIIYGLLVLCVNIINSLIYFLYCKIIYKEYINYMMFDLKIFKKMISFSGWSLLGASAYVANNQGNNILLNIFFGPITNAARSVAYQISNVLNSFSGNFFMSLRPPLVKSYAEGNYKEVMRLFYLSTKFTYYSLLMIGLPIAVSTEELLTLWLNTISREMVIFSKLIIAYTIILALNNPITAIIQASGNNKKYHLYVESVTLLSLPLTYLFLRLGFDAQITFWIMIVIFLIAHIVRLFILKNAIPFKTFDYIQKFAIRAIIATFLSLISCVLFKSYFDTGLFSIILTCLFSMISVLFFTFIIGIDNLERKLIVNYLKSKKLHFKKF